MPREFVFYPDPQFKCDLKKMQCTALNKNGKGPRCKRDVVIGLDKCWIHLMKDHKLKIKETSLRGFKFKGLFAWDKTKGDHAIIFKKGDLIVPYNGEVLTANEMEGRYGEGDENTAPYVIENERTERYEDAACKRTAASISNQASGKFRNNAQLDFHPEDTDDENIYLIATKDIKNKKEIFCDYGQKYRLDDAITHRTRYKRRR